MRRRTARRPHPADPLTGPGSLARQVLDLADTMTDVLDQAATRSLAVPPAITNTVHELRGWAARIDHGTTAAPAAVDAIRLLAYLRGLPDQQLLALLADLPWSRLDALLDAVQVSDRASPRWRQPP